MKVAGGDDQVLIRKDGWIVSNRIDLILKYIGYIIYGVLGGTVNLWYTAERIRILHMFLRPVYQFTSLQQVTYPAGCFNLPLVWPYLLYQWMEWLDPAIEGIERQGSN